MVKMPGFQGLGMCCNVDRGGWLINGFVIT
jgi:hypothetical protein